MVQAQYSSFFGLREPFWTNWSAIAASEQCKYSINCMLWYYFLLSGPHPGQIVKPSGTRDKVHKSGTVPDILGQLESIIPSSIYTSGQFQLDHVTRYSNVPRACSRSNKQNSFG